MKPDKARSCGARSSSDILVYLVWDFSIVFSFFKSLVWVWFSVFCTTYNSGRNRYEIAWLVMGMSVQTDSIPGMESRSQSKEDKERISRRIER